MPRYTKLSTYASKTGSSCRNASQDVPSGVCNSSTMIVIRIAITPSLKASSLPLGTGPPESHDAAARVQPSRDSKEAAVADSRSSVDEAHSGAAPIGKHAATAKDWRSVENPGSPNFWREALRPLGPERAPLSALDAKGPRVRAFLRSG